jgi:two-component system response regulator PilR (NtrC family)
MKAALSPNSNSNSHSNSMPVLFVDDSAVARVALNRRLVALGLDVVMFGSAAEASAAHGATFSAALLDIELGDGYGPELAARLREEAPGLPIAFLTAGGPAEVLAAAARLGPVFSKTSEVDDAVRWIAAAAGRG